MKILLETSTLVAAMLPEHAHHTPAVAWLSFAKAEACGYFVAAHSTAECFSVLTRLPRKPKIAPAEARELLEANVFSCAELLTLPASDYVRIIRGLDWKGLAGAIVHDAVIAQAAENADVERLVTLNPKHFLKVWNGDPSRIVSPLDEPPPARL